MGEKSQKILGLGWKVASWKFPPLSLLTWKGRRLGMEGIDLGDKLMGAVWDGIPGLRNLPTCGRGVHVRGSQHGSACTLEKVATDVTPAP